LGSIDRSAAAEFAATQICTRAFSWISGKHSIRFGFDGRYYRPAGLVQQTPNSILTFENRFTNQPGAANTGNPVAELMLGIPYTGRATQFAESNGWVSLKYYYYGFYLQDEIRLLPKLTLNIGLRYEYQTPYYERFGDLAIFDPVKGQFYKLDEDIPRLHDPDGNNFAPRVGLAWSVNSKTVIRAGSGVFYGQPRGSEFSSFQLSPPFVIDSTLTSNPNVPELIGRLFPRTQVRDPATGKILLSPNTNVLSLDPKFRTNYTFQWNFGIQRELAAGWLLDTSYVGNSAQKLTGRDLVNQAYVDADPLRPTPVNNRRPNPNIGDVSMVKSLDPSNYHALNVKLNKRFSRGFSVLGGLHVLKSNGNWRRAVRRPVVRKNSVRAPHRCLGGLFDQVILVMQAAKHRCLPDAISGWQLVPVVTDRTLSWLGSGMPGPNEL